MTSDGQGSRNLCGCNPWQDPTCRAGFGGLPPCIVVLIKVYYSVIFFSCFSVSKAVQNVAFFWHFCKLSWKGRETVEADYVIMTRLNLSQGGVLVECHHSEKLNELLSSTFPPLSGQMKDTNACPPSTRIPSQSLAQPRWLIRTRQHVLCCRDSHSP